MAFSQLNIILIASSFHFKHPISILYWLSFKSFLDPVPVFLFASSKGVEKWTLVER